MERPRPRTVVCVDRRMPPSADIIASAMIKRFPQLEPRWSYVQSDLSAIVPHPSCVLASVHACGTLTDYLIEMAIGNGTNASPLAIVPCCHTANGRKGYQPHPLSGMDSAEQVAALVEERKQKQEGAEKHEAVADVVDDVRIRTLRNAGYDVEEVMLPEAFTGRNRVLLGVASRPVSSMAMGARSNHTKSNQQQQFFHQRKQQGNNRGMRMPPPPLIRIPLADDNESIAQCHAISGRERATTRLMEQIPKHFSPSLVMSIWLTTASSTSTGTTSSTSQGEIKVCTSAEDSDSSSFGLTVETLQAFADQCCGEVEAEERPIQCAVGVFGEVNVQSTTGRRSQLYRFTYGKPEGSAIDLGKASVSRTAAKRIQSMIRERIIDKFGDSVLR